MSRADEEKAKYLSKIASIRNNLLQEASRVQETPLMNDLYTKMTQLIMQSEQSENDCSSEEEGFEESKDELSLSLIKRQEGLSVESVTLSEEVVAKSGDNFRQTDLKSYFKK